MLRQFAFLAPMIAALAVSVSVSTIFTSGSHAAAETCLAAPNSPAPQGSHWYYRLDRATQRKCWRLVKLDQQPQAAAKQAAPQPEPEKYTAPAAATSAGRVQSPQHGWLTRSASAIPETVAPTQGSDSSDRASARAEDPVVAPAPAPVAQEQPSDAATVPVSPAQAAESKQTNVAPQEPGAAAPGGTGMTQFVFVAIAGLSFLAAAIFFLVDLRRRRTDVLTRIARDDEASFDTMDEDRPTFSPMPPMTLTPQHDDVDEALWRSRRRRMAA